MATRRLTDNWTLQDAGVLLSDGFDGDTASQITISPEDRSLRYEETSADVVRIRALLQLISDVIFSDEVWVDADFTNSWSEFSPLRPLQQALVLVATPLRDRRPEWVGRREAIEDELCVSEDIRRRHLENKASYLATGQEVDPFLSQVIWGGAGMLARADLLRVPYVPHPARARLFEQTALLRTQPAATDELRDFVDAQRLKLHSNAAGTGLVAQLVLPPIAIRVIEESSGVEEIIPAALRKREEFAELRQWIGSFQQALYAENVEEILARRKVLRSVPKNIDRLAGSTTEGDTSLQLGIGPVRFTIKPGGLINAAKNWFGVRAILNRFIVAPTGRNSVTKLLALFGHQTSTLGRRIERELLQPAVRH